MLHAQWVDLGIYLQSLMLLATGKGLATCAQGFWQLQRFCEPASGAAAGLPDRFWHGTGL
jgi:hypothetical protein